jgi:diguanylate cyclase (GGDEF)-like protein
MTYVAQNGGLLGSAVLPNRVRLLDLLGHRFRPRRRSKQVSAMLFLDFDRIEEVEDIHGHHVGHELLAAVAERLTGLLRPGDTLSHFSGGEFVILCENIADAVAIGPIAIRLNTELSRPFQLSCGEVTATASIGVVIVNSRTPCVANDEHFDRPCITDLRGDS